MHLGLFGSELQDLKRVVHGKYVRRVILKSSLAPSQYHSDFPPSIHPSHTFNHLLGHLPVVPSRIHTRTFPVPSHAHLPGPLTCLATFRLSRAGSISPRWVQARQASSRRSLRSDVVRNGSTSERERVMTNSSGARDRSAAAYGQAGRDGKYDGGREHYFRNWV